MSSLLGYFSLILMYLAGLISTEMSIMMSIVILILTVTIVFYERAQGR